MDCRKSPEANLRSYKTTFFFSNKKTEIQNGSTTPAYSLSICRKILTLRRVHYGIHLPQDSSTVASKLTLRRLQHPTHTGWR